ncbi:MAG: hypothetical protein OET90_01625 [Desulfuromonadales bacterium]|nr:hypothetical protein [Desulfuromonadales bacterium]
MKIIKEGDNGRAVCQDCGLVPITYRLKDIPFSDKSGLVKNVLAGVCDACERVVSVPRQSTPQIKSEYQKTRVPVESRVPAHFLDILSLASAKIREDLGHDFSRHLILYYLHGINSGHIKCPGIKGLLDSDIASAPASKRVSLKVSRNTEKEFSEVVHKVGLKNNSELIKGIILKINQDIVQPENPVRFKELKTLASAFG